jgi:hypothetical protein
MVALLPGITVADPRTFNADVYDWQSWDWSQLKSRFISQELP